MNEAHQSLSFFYDVCCCAFEIGWPNYRNTPVNNLFIDDIAQRTYTQMNM